MKAEITYGTFKKFNPKFLKGFITFYFIWLFALSGLSKILDQSFLAIWINEPFLLDLQLGRILNWLIPIIELVVALLLALKKFKVEALFAVILITITYSLYVAWNLLAGYEMPCSCTGFVAQFSWNQYLIFNLFNLALALYGLSIYRKNI